MRATLVTLTALLMACGSDVSPPRDGGSSSTGDSGMSARDAAGGGRDSGGSSRDGGPTTGSTYEEVEGWVRDYHAAHPGREGDINALSPSEVEGDPDAARLLALCGADQRPVIPYLAWEYGGSDHAWINPEAAALVICVYTPVSPSTEHWAYDAATDHVTADVYVLFPDQNPCADRTGPDQVLGCLGDMSNIEILVDTASYDDGAGAGLSLAEASTELRLIQPDGTTVHLYDGI